MQVTGTRSNLRASSTNVCSKTKYSTLVLFKDDDKDDEAADETGSSDDSVVVVKDGEEEVKEGIDERRLDVSSVSIMVSFKVII